MNRISVVIISFNEEEKIGNCIHSVEGVADEIVVVDSYSTDRTEQICIESGVKFIQHEFEGYIEQKNFALTQVSYPCILSLDADEALSEKLRESILEVKEHWKFDGYYMSRLNYYCGKSLRFGGWYPDRKLRLWKSSGGQWTGINPHDKFELSDGSHVGILKGDILHYSYTSIRGHIEQVNNFTDVSAKALYKKGIRSNMFKIIFGPIFKFFRDYFLKFGFLDGYYGLVVSIISSHATFLKYVKLKQLENEEK